MSRIGAGLLHWSPRILSLAFALFLSLFALDVFQEFHGFRLMVLAFLVHLIPALVIVAILAVAWRWAWIGAVLYLLAADYYAWSWTIPPRHVHWAPIAGISGPLLVMAALFLADWLERPALRPAH
jgi:hypothetical protein